MRLLAYNVVPVCLIALGAWLAYLETGGWGWCIIGAVLTSVYPSSNTEKKS